MEETVTFDSGGTCQVLFEVASFLVLEFRRKNPPTADTPKTKIATIK